MDLGGQTATLFYLGRGHTDGDLLVGTASTLFAGDLVEQGSHPSFEDSFPEDWADALRHLSALRHRYEFLIPGHGEPCGDQFVKTMANTMTTAVRQAVQATRETPDDATKAIPILPYGPEQSRWFIQRLQDTRARHYPPHVIGFPLSPGPVLRHPMVRVRTAAPRLALERFQSSMQRSAVILGKQTCRISRKQDRQRPR